jgi:hypothetical protein
MRLGWLCGECGEFERRGRKNYVEDAKKKKDIEKAFNPSIYCAGSY